MIREALVVGGGIGGLSTSIALARTGLNVTLAEKSEAITEVGAGLQISPNGLAVLRGLGLEPDLETTGAVRAQAVQLCDYKAGQVVASLQLKRRAEQKYYFVHRADLIDLLLDGARQSGVQIELGTELGDVIPGDLPKAIFDNGKTRSADLIVCADGLHSVGRHVLNPDTRPAFTGQVAWRATVQRSDSTSTVKVTMGPGRHLVSYPLRGGTMTNVVAVQ